MDNDRIISAANMSWPCNILVCVEQIISQHYLMNEAKCSRSRPNRDFKAKILAMRLMPTFWHRGREKNFGLETTTDILHK